MVLSLRLRLEERLQNLQGGSGRCQACCVIQGYWKTNSLIILIQVNTHLSNFTGYVFLVATMFGGLEVYFQNFPYHSRDCWLYGKYMRSLWVQFLSVVVVSWSSTLKHHIGSILDILKFCRVMKVVTTYRVDVQRAICLAIIIEPGSFSFLLHFLRS